MYQSVARKNKALATASEVPGPNIAVLYDCFVFWWVVTCTSPVVAV